ncbi:hypothetical protein TWF102_007692 [Orbilia oligospora]|uniref:DUF6604 domain-containing protein n=1 Tax=Orbilia oligospora TaxID=2813651 RepID=A0A7C8J4N2_ORBOL|nr:hypothetical protein TWF102_007692 [Orbilia oligospora]
MSTLPEAIIDTYKRYKAGTNRVISFLVQSSCAPAKDLVPKHKPKASKKKGKSASKVKPENINLRDLVPLAKNVVSKGLKVPSHLLSILEDVIKARSKCARWYRGQTPHGLAFEHEKHEHFIRVLEEIHAILKPAEGSQPASAQKTQQRSEFSSRKVKNLFEHLDSEEPLCKGVENITIDSSYFVDDSTSKPTGAKQSLTPEESKLEEQLFALFCFFQDISDLRLFIGRIWTEYMKGQSGLMSVAITTAAAFDLIKKANEELIAQFPDMKQHTQVVKFFERNGYAVTGPNGKGFSEAECNLENVEAISLSLALCVKTWYHVLMPRVHEKVPSPPKKKTETEGSSSSSLTEFKYLDALALDYLILGGLMPAALEGMGYPILQGFREAQRTRILPSWLVISFDIITRLHQTLWLDGSEQPYDELLTHSLSVRKQMTCLIKFSRTWESIGLPHLANHADMINDLISDPLELLTIWTVQDFVKQLKSELKVPGAELLQTDRHFLLRNDPVLCGLVLSRVRLSIHSLGLHLAVQDSVVAMAAHVYNTGLVNGLLKSKWPDMEDLINIHALDKTLFIGSRPTTTDGCPSRFFTSMGFSVQSRAKGGTFIEALMKFGNGERLPYRILNRRREIGFTSVFANAAKKEFKWCLDELTFHFTEVIGNQIKRYLDLKKEKLLTEFENPMLDETTVAQWQKHKKLNQLQLLEVLYNSIEADDFHFNFDYISMAERCAKFLTVVDKASRDLFSIALGDSILLQKLGVRSNVWPIAVFDGSDTGMFILKLACDALVPLLKNQGDVERRKNLSLICKKDRDLVYVDVKAVPTFQKLLSKLPNPFEQVLITTMMDEFPNSNVYLIGLNTQSTTSNNLAGAFVMFSQSRELLAQLNEGKQNKPIHEADDGWMPYREALLFCFLELLGKHRGALRKETHTKARRTALVLSTRPEFPLEALQAELDLICKEVPGFPDSMQNLKDRVGEAFEYREKMMALETSAMMAQDDAILINAGWAYAETYNFDRGGY